ncbi:MAG: response regulator [Thermonemataceae bacterium]|nr:response regulator [Thermonemataceae bacterium]
MSKVILIAEDSSVIQSMAKKVLETLGYKVLTAKNGEKVLETLSKEHIDLILMDLNMPVMNGEDCVAAIRKEADEQKAQTPIIAITGNAANYSLEEFKAKGFDNYLPKPINFDLLIEVVKKTLN